MDETIFDKVQEIDLKKTMEQSYIDYAMSVISQRALPDVRDGLKPVQRRVLYSMIELNNGPDKPHRKCARIVGDTMGKYHPHGDSSIYGALVVMAQDFKYGMPLVDGHGNFGSIEGDGAAAMRYTEARLQKITQQAKQNVRNIEEPKCTTNLKKYNNNSGSKAVDTYREVPETKPGSLASKANMVAEFDKKNKTKKK